MLVVGKFIGSFEDKNTGRTVVYSKVYCTVETERDGLEGLEVEILKITPELYHLVNVGDEVEPNYNKYGKIISFSTYEGE